jgi:vacuole morphology and inheritance protein 14
MSSQYFPTLLPPIIDAMGVQDVKVKFQACETMYNVVKFLRTIILKEFNEVFSALIRICADFDEEVKKLSLQLDKLLKDVVSESVIDSKYFDLKSFMPILCEKLQVRNPVMRQLLINWINTLNTFPNLHVSHYLPQFLPELMLMIGDTNKFNLLYPHNF